MKTLTLGTAYEINIIPAQWMPRNKAMIIGATSNGGVEIVVVDLDHGALAVVPDQAVDDSSAVDDDLPSS